MGRQLSGREAAQHARGSRFSSQSLKERKKSCLLSGSLTASLTWALFETHGEAPSSPCDITISHSLVFLFTKNLN